MDNDNNVIVMEAEDMGNGTLEKQIENALVKENITDKVIASLKEKYGGLKLRDENDKEQYLIIKDARKEVRKVGILAERICEAGRSDAIKIQRLWLSKQKEVLDKIGEVQNNLDGEIKKFDDEVDRKANEEAQRKENEYMQRQSVLIKMGARYDSGSFVLNHISYEATIVRESDVDIWEETILPKYKREYEKNEAVRVAEENKRKEEMEAMRLQQEEMAKQQRELKEAQEQLRLQKEESEKLQREAAERERIFKVQEEEKLWRDRLSKLNDIGWNGQYAYAKWDDKVSVFTYDELIKLPDDIFYERAKDYINSVAIRHKESEEKRKLKIEEDIRIAKEEAVTKERLRIEEEQRQRELQKKIDEEKKQRELDASDDKTKFAAWLAEFKKLPPLPTMKSPAYRTKVSIIREKIEDINEL